MWAGMSIPDTTPPPITSGNSIQQQQQTQKHDIFVGNLAFSTTEEQLHQAFSEIGRIVKVRMVTDLETGKPRGFCFIEFEDPQDALSAIRNMNEYELNGRKIRVNFSNSSHLETLAGKLGMDMKRPDRDISSATTAVIPSRSRTAAESGTNAVVNALKNMNKGEIYDILKKLKEIADDDPDEARKIISGHPQLPEAILHLMSQLDMIVTPISTNSMDGITPDNGAVAPSTDIGLSIPQNVALDPRRAADPRTAASSLSATPSLSTALRSDPRHRIDPRAEANPRVAVTAVNPRSDPRVARGVPPPPSISAISVGSVGVPALPPPSLPPPPPYPGQQPLLGVPPPPSTGAVGLAGLDPNLVQQVMGLTQAQIAQLPPDKQESILALQQQIQKMS